MKLLFAIVRSDNEEDVVLALNKERFQVTKLATSGGFLKKGNATLLIGCADELVEKAVQIIRDECGDTQDITVNMPYMSGSGMVGSSMVPTTVTVGGATIFVTPVDRFEKF